MIAPMLFLDFDSAVGTPTGRVVSTARMLAAELVNEPARSGLKVRWLCDRPKSPLFTLASTAGFGARPIDEIVEKLDRCLKEGR